MADKDVSKADMLAALREAMRMLKVGPAGGPKTMKEAMTSKKKMMRGGMAKKKMRGGGMAKIAKKKMMRGGMVKKK